MILFLAHTPMQLMNAVILAKTEFSEESCELYYTNNIALQSEKTEKEGIFSSIYQIEIHRHIPKSGAFLAKMLVRVRNALELGQIRKELPTDPMRYDRVFLSGINLRNIEFYYAMKSVNPAIHLSLYEEGVCEYYYMAKKDYGKILFSKFFFHRFYLQDCESLYVHNRDMVSLAWKQIAVKEILPIQSKPELLPLLNRILGYKTREFAGCEGKIIMLEQAFGDQVMEALQREALDTIVKEAGKENVVIKLHPRSQPEKYGNDFTYLKIDCPFEIAAMNEPVDHMTFVSMGSSAVLNLKLMLCQEPRIILLNSIFDSRKKSNEEFIKLIQRVMSSCNSGNFYIPESNEQFLDNIKSVKIGANIE